MNSSSDPRRARMQDLRHVRRRRRIALPEHVQDGHADVRKTGGQVLVDDLFIALAQHGGELSVLLRPEPALGKARRDLFRDAVGAHADFVAHAPPGRDTRAAREQCAGEEVLLLREQFQRDPSPEGMGDEPCPRNTPRAQQARRERRILPHAPCGGRQGTAAERGEVEGDHPVKAAKIRRLIVKTLLARAPAVQKHERLARALLRKCDLHALKAHSAPPLAGAHRAPYSFLRMTSASSPSP